MRCSLGDVNDAKLSANDISDDEVGDTSHAQTDEQPSNTTLRLILRSGH